MFVLRRVQSASRILLKRTFQSSSAHMNKDSDVINLTINGEKSKFPSVWLRDNCQCEKCFHQSAKSRILDWTKFDLNITATNIEEHQNGINITWNDGHTSKYLRDWLKFRSFTAENQENYSKTIYKPTKITWQGSDFDQICTRHKYDTVLSSEKDFYQFLFDLSVYGVTLIEDAPNTDTALNSIVGKIGFPKETHYGKRFIVQHVTNTSNVAYLSNNLQVHTDLPYYEYCPGVNLLHCLVQTKSIGGENLLSDCHYVANYMAENYPSQFKLLTEIEVEWSDIGTEDGNEFYKLYRSPVIVLDKHGQIIRINFSIPQRGSHFPTKIDHVKPWYEAHKLFLELNHKFSAKFKTKPGDILAFDNIRLLHGRNAYEDSNNNVRKLIGTYIDWDEIYSRLRCLKVKLDYEKGI